VLSRPGLSAPPNLGDVYHTSGARAAYDALEALIAETPEKKWADTFKKTGLADIQMPVSLTRGAELSLANPSPLRACAWRDGAVVCEFEGTVASPTEYQVSCRTNYGASAPVESSQTTPENGVVRFSVRGVEACWKLDATGVSVEPRALTDLEGVGLGTEFIPPELVQLTKQETEEILHKNAPNVQVCIRRASEQGIRVSGTTVIGYHIAEDGSLDKVWVESATTRNETIESCMLERFQRIRIRPPMGGFEGGTFTFTFL
jgi:hypothetical protein